MLKPYDFLTEEEKQLIERWERRILKAKTRKEIRKFEELTYDILAVAKLRHEKHLLENESKISNQHANGGK